MLLSSHTRCSHKKCFPTLMYELSQRIFPNTFLCSCQHVKKMDETGISLKMLKKCPRQSTND